MFTRNAPIEAYFQPVDIHEQLRAELDGHILAILLAAVITLGHALNTYLLFWEEMSVFVALVIHLILVAVAAFFSLILDKAGRDSRFALLLTITSACAGVFGSAGSLLAMLLTLIYDQFYTPFKEWFAQIFPVLHVSKPEEIYENLLVGRDEHTQPYSVIPFLDVMTIGSESQKRSALSRMTQKFDPAFAPAFKLALKDPNNSIRVQAATAIAKIENAFLERLMKISELERRLPDDMVVKLALAEHYDDYAFTGILDSERERDNRKKAYQKYTEYLAQRPDDIKTRVKVGRILLRKGRYDEAADWFAGSIGQGYSDDALMLWYMETLYKAGRYDELRHNAQLFKARLDDWRKIRPSLVQAIEMWANGVQVKTLETV